MKNDKQKNFLLGVLLVGIVTMTIAYAALSTTLSINSAATVRGGTWEVKFVAGSGAVGCPIVAPQSGRSAYFNGAPSLTDTTISSLTAVLTQPGDTCTYNFKIRNAGTIDARLSTINTPTKTCTPEGTDATTACANVSRTLTYSGTATLVSGGTAGSSTMTNGAPVSANDVLKAGEEIPVNLTISYANGTTTEHFPAADVNIAFGEQSLVFVQN